jgi:hypothetical protein
MDRLIAWTGVAVLALSLGGCGHEDHSGHAHQHQAPHGGTLIPLGDHEFNLELVLDATNGRLTAYVLSGHADEFVRVPVESFQITARLADREELLTFKAAASSKTGETVGDTSQFEAQADWLKSIGAFEGVLKKLEIKTIKYETVPFRFPRNG